MGFPAALAAGRFPVALEITPPQRPLPGVLRRRAGLLGGCAQAINVIQRPDRQSSLDASLLLREAGLDPVWHLVNRGRSRSEIAADLDRARDGGIEQVLCIRGDHAGDDGSDTPSIREVVAMARERMPGALIGATLNQYATGREPVLRNLLAKLTAGATYVQTQPVFDLGVLLPYAEALRDRPPESKIIAMVMPLLSIEAARSIQKRLGVVLPERLLRRLETGTPEAAWRAFDETVSEMVQNRLVDGLAVMTFEMDPDSETGRRIIVALQAADIINAGTPMSE